ncbi:MAG: hypothetical protein E7571_05390 [Ruminococcaceae bacterium]|nr:hypothetical protein [Oscillospiraceae bacterium]
MDNNRDELKNQLCEKMLRIRELGKQRVEISKEISKLYKEVDKILDDDVFQSCELTDNITYQIVN